MSIYIMARVWQQSKSKNGDRLVLLAIADYADEKARAFPSVASLSAKSNLDIRSVQRSVSRLVEMGELAVREGAGPHGVNVYYVLLPESPAQPATTADYDLPEAIKLPEIPPANCHPRQIAAPANDPFTPGNLPPNPSEIRQDTKRECDARPDTVLKSQPESQATAPTKPPSKPEAAKRPDPMAHLERPDGWPPVLGLGDLDEPIALLYQAFRSARFPGKAECPILPGEIRKDLPPLQDLHAAGITPAKLREAAQRALAAWSSRERVTLAAIASNWSSLEETPAPAKPMPPGKAKNHRTTPEEAREKVRRGLNTVLTRGDGF